MAWPFGKRGWSGALLALPVQEAEALGEQLFELADAAALEQHVPVGADRLDLLRLGLVAVDQEGGGAADAALPGVGDLGVGRERHGQVVALGAVVARCLTRG